MQKEAHFVTEQERVGELKEKVPLRKGLWRVCRKRERNMRKTSRNVRQ